MDRRERRNRYPALPDRGTVMEGIRKSNGLAEWLQWSPAGVDLWSRH